MQSYVIEPLLGVGAARLGMARDEVHRTMHEAPESFRKTPASEHETDAFHQSAFQVFYTGEPPLVEFIELSTSSHLRALFQDLSIFETPADELLAALGVSHRFTSDDPSAPCHVVFPDLQMSLWRPYPPDSPGDEDGRHFLTVGIGIHGYFTQA